MKQEVNNFKRKALFEIYNERSNPFLFVTTKVDITNIIKYCKVHKNYYATIAYFILMAAEELDCFKYRFENNKVYKYDSLRPCFVQMFNDDEIGFFSCNKKNDFKEYIKDFEERQNKFLKDKKSENSTDQGEVWFSCTPWFEFTSLIVPFDKKITIPQFIWGKYIKEDGRYYTNLMIMVHHGFADGKHIAMFLDFLKNKIDNFDEEVN